MKTLFLVFALLFLPTIASAQTLPQGELLIDTLNNQTDRVSMVSFDCKYTNAAQTAISCSFAHAVVVETVDQCRTELRVAVIAFTRVSSTQWKFVSTTPPLLGAVLNKDTSTGQWKFTSTTSVNGVVTSTNFVPTLEGSVGACTVIHGS